MQINLIQKRRKIIINSFFILLIFYFIINMKLLLNTIKKQKFNEMIAIQKVLIVFSQL